MEISYFLTYHTLRYLVYKGNYGRLDTTHANHTHNLPTLALMFLLGEEDVGGGMSCHF